MATSAAEQLAAFAARPPKPLGGIELAVQLQGPRHAELRFSHQGHRAEFRAAFLSVPYPSGLRRLLAQEPDLEAVIVDRIPRGLVEEAERAGIAVIDRTGHGRVVGPGFVYVAPPTQAALSAARRASASPFAPKASRIVRALLANPEERWNLSQLANVVDVDVGNAHRILASLVDMGVVERDEDAYLLVDAGSLLEAWAEFHRRPNEKVTLPVGPDLERDLQDLTFRLEGQAVISGEFAAETLAPYLSAAGAVVHCLSREGWESIAGRGKGQSWVPAPPGRGRITVDLADEGCAQFHSVVNDIPIVHPVQLYVDLFRDFGRGREAAEHLRRELIPY